MRHICAVTEEEVVALWLKTELASVRYRDRLLGLLDQAGLDQALLEAPDLADSLGNARRLCLLGEHRGFRRHEQVCTRLPDEIAWHRYALDPEELPAIRYVNYDYWNELSGGTRLAGEAARNVRRGLEVFRVSSAGFLEIASAVAAGAILPELILVAEDDRSPLTVLEGHVRLTAYCLALPRLKGPVTAIIGFGKGMADV
jgi:hypothetical protein